MSLTQRVLLGSLLVVAVFTAVVVALVDRRLATRLAAETVITLGREATMITPLWRPGVNADSLADEVGARLERRVTLIDSAGTVIGDSDFDPPALGRLQNHSNRPEVIAARATGFGSSRRPSPSAGDEELYVAVRAPRGHIVRVSVSTHALGEIVGAAQRDVLGAAMFALLVAFGLAYLFARSVSGPIVVLRDVARQLAAGDLSQRPHLAAAGEVSDLADALSSMAEQLETRLSALAAEDAFTTALVESLNEGVLAVDAEGRVIRANESARALLGVRQAVPFPASDLPQGSVLREVLAAAQAGEATDPTETNVGGLTLGVTARPLRAGGAVVALVDLTPFRTLEAVRRDFVANVSHELRTPLTAVRGFAETLADDDTLAEQPRRFAETIRGNAVRMQQLVDDLLDLSRIESGGWVPEPQPLNVALVAREAVGPIRAMADAKGLEIRIEATEAPTAYVDPTALHQVIANLVSNAVRHTQHGSITVFTRRESTAVVVGVRDTGIGIAAEHLPRIFERFYRVDPGRSRAEGGTGLGLAIVRHLVEAHGGRVIADSVVGQGTTISSVFPDA